MLSKVTNLHIQQIYKWEWDQTSAKKDNIDVTGESGRASTHDQDDELLDLICSDLGIDMQPAAEKLVEKKSEFATRVLVRTSSMPQPEI